MKVLNLPRQHQTYGYDCGAAVLEIVLAYYGIELREELVMKRAGTTINGTPIKGIVDTAAKLGLKCASKAMTIDEVKKYLDRKIPVILLLQAWTSKKKVNWEKDWADGHYVIAIGYNREKVVFQDPYSFKLTYLKYDELEQRWHDIDSKGRKYVHHCIAIQGRKPEFSKHRIIHMD